MSELVLGNITCHRSILWPEILRRALCFMKWLIMGEAQDDNLGNHLSLFSELHPLCIGWFCVYIRYCSRCRFRE
jgi:hypothetical protein